MMQLSDFDYELPPELIAQHPLPERTGSRLMCLGGSPGVIQDRRFSELPRHLRRGDLLILNDTRVIPARLFGRKETGGRIELLVERVLDAHRLLAQLRMSKSPRPGSRIHISDDAVLEIEGRRDEFFVLRNRGMIPLGALLEKYGHTPLPPYIRRPDSEPDRERYQTVYAQIPGAVAAPTAGLHFDPPLLGELRSAGVEVSKITLHVGAGTFQPVRVEDLAAHRMHPEQTAVSSQVCEAIDTCRTRGGRVVAVGTTVVRALETAARCGTLRPFSGDTRIFIHPGFPFQVVDVLLTNFHLPKSTLLMLVSAFGGHARVMAAYRHAVAAGYRFYSYGDAMLLTREPAPGPQESAHAL